MSLAAWVTRDSGALRYPLLGGLMHLPLSGFPALLQAVEIRLVGQEHMPTRP